MTHPYSPGSVFMLPHGTRIVHKLQEFLRKEYIKFGYQEVITPLIYKKGLWETSGHWQNYMDDMYMVQGGQKGAENDEEGLFGLKPMNCPGHCLIFDSTPKSYRDLPIRLADFSPLHR
jgi:threonyl-tRNA synthetase